MPKKIDWVGRKYGRLTVIEDLGVNPAGSRILKCLCKCGNTTEVQAGNLSRGRTVSCGCLQREHSREYHTKHGMTGTRLYNIWCGMKNRCYNPKNNRYYRYGARGIKICNEWLHSFEAFRDWALANGYRDDLSINRIDNEGGYCPENCNWATDEEQQNNKDNNIYLTINGKTQTLTQWVDDPEINIYDLDYDTAKMRRRYGYSDEEIFFVPLRDDRVLIKGKYQSLSQHFKDPDINIYNLGESTVKYRMYKMKLSAEEALSTPPRGKRKKTTSSP